MIEKIVLTCDAKLWKRPMDMKDVLLLGEYYEDGIFRTDRMFPIEKSTADFLSRFDKVELNFVNKRKK